MGVDLARQTLGATYKVDSPPRYFDRREAVGKLLRPENQVAYIAAPTAAQTRDTLISAGIMKAS
jgi:hypothetical protein